MGYKSKADGPVVSKGKTNAKVFPDDGPKVTQSGPKVIQSGPKASKSGLNKAYKAVGRNMARANNQRGR
jgi:hypothetical protein